MVQSIIEDEFVIPQSGTESNSLMCERRALAGIIAPAMTTDTTVALEVSDDGPDVDDADATFIQATVKGTDVEFTVSASAATADAYDQLLYFRRMRIVCTTAQAAARTIKPQFVDL